MYKIVVTPNNILANVSKPVEKFDKKLKNILSSMEKTLLNTSDPVGVGLAAAQVGLTLRIFLMRPTEKSKVRFIINPEILSISKDSNDFISQSGRKKKAIDDGKIPPPKDKRLLEGCLSMPQIWGYVQRKKEITISYFDENGKKLEGNFTGFPAIIVQHEIDHLNGILFTKHVMEQNEKLYRSHKNDKGEEEFDEISI